MKQLLRTLPLFILSLFIFSFPTHAFYIQSGDNLSLPKEKTYNETVIIAGNSLTIDSPITGDLICAGQNITINSAIKGSVICAGQNIKLNGPVDGNVRIAGQLLEIFKTATIKGDLLAGGQTINLSSTINRDVLVASKNITLDPKSKIIGNFDYYTDSTSSVSASLVKGKVTQHLLPQRTAPEVDFSKAKQAVSITAKIFSLASVLIVGLFLVLVLKSLDNQNISQIKLFFLGFAVIFLTPIFIMFLFMTLVGIPLAFILGLLYLLGFFIAIPLSVISFGQLIHPNRFIGLIVGALIFSLLSLLPVFGWIFGFIFLCDGFGIYTQLFISKK